MVKTEPQMIFRADNPFCRISVKELLNMRTISARKKELDQEILKLTDTKMRWWDRKAKAESKEKVRDLVMQAKMLGDQKAEWWLDMRKKYCFVGPAIVSLERGEIILGVAKDV